MHFTIWDILLLIAVPIQATATAYVFQPKWKALLVTIPIPFTLATLAVGKTVDGTHILGALLYLVFSGIVYWLHARARVNIIVSIGIGAAAFCVTGSLLSPVVGGREDIYWVLSGVALVVGALLYVLMPFRPEPGHRSPLPVWIKFPTICLIIAGLIGIKSLLSGVMAMFPMVTVIAAYEARHSLWTIFRQSSVILLAFLPLQTAFHILIPRYGPWIGIGVGWAIFLVVLPLLHRRMQGPEENEKMEDWKSGHRLGRTDPESSDAGSSHCG